MIIKQKRRKIGYTYGSVSGSYSFSGKSIEHESLLEKDLLRLLEYDSRVTDVIEQPMTIEYKNIHGRDTVYTPDFLVHFQNQKSWLIEVKPHKKLTKNWEELRLKFKVGFKYAKENNFIFHIFHEPLIKGKELKLINQLERYKHLNFQEPKTQPILDILQMTNSMLVDDLLNKVINSDADKKEMLRRIWFLVSTHKIWCDLSQELDVTRTQIWVKESL